jgi:hypothetical protein
MRCCIKRCSTDFRIICEKRKEEDEEKCEAVVTNN